MKGKENRKDKMIRKWNWENLLGGYSHRGSGNIFTVITSDILLCSIPAVLSWWTQ
jgi:hypothetical protein